MQQVAAAIIIEKGHILICQRGPGGPCAHLWEFPGGKLEPGETLQDCLCRECLEELNLEIMVDGLYHQTPYCYGEKEFLFSFFRAHIMSGALQQNVHAAIAWVPLAQLLQYPFCPADQDVINRLNAEKASI